MQKRFVLVAGAAALAVAGSAVLALAVSKGSSAPSRPASLAFGAR
jgi:hypothetical protein